MDLGVLRSFVKMLNLAWAAVYYISRTILEVHRTRRDIVSQRIVHVCQIYL